jgi:hypothetical protein
MKIIEEFSSQFNVNSYQFEAHFHNKIMTKYTNNNYYLYFLSYGLHSGK